MFCMFTGPCSDTVIDHYLTIDGMDTSKNAELSSLRISTFQEVQEGHKYETHRFVKYSNLKNGVELSPI